MASTIENPTAAHAETWTEERRRTAERLLASSARLSFDPLTDVDWDAAPVPGRYYLPPRRLSLYGTALWDALTEAERIELSKHEFASLASAGIWFEEVLMQILLRHVYDRDATTAHVQYALTEIADECRHSVMFGRTITWTGAPYYGPNRVAHNIGRVFKTVSTHAQTFGGTLYVEEVLDAIQREVMRDESLQPLCRQVCRIHVMEEARHISYAREEMARKHHGPLGRLWEQLWIGGVVYFATTTLINPLVYAQVGIDPRAGRRAARRNPEWRRTKAELAAKTIALLTQAGFVGRGNRWMLRAAGVLPPR